MRNFIYITLLILFVSCNQTPILDGETPFVVGMIVKYNDTHSEYYSTLRASGILNSNFSDYPRIVLPSGLYQINDTISIIYKKNN